MSKLNILVRSGTESVVNNPRTSILAIMLLGLIFISGLAGFDLNPSTRDYLGKDTPIIQELIALEKEYVEDINIFLMIKSTSGTVFDQQTLIAIEALTNSAWQLPYVKRVDSLSNFQHTWSDNDNLIVENLIESAHALSNPDITRIKNIALNETRLVNLFVSEDGKATAINILFEVDLGNSKQRQEIYRELEKIYSEAQTQYPFIEIFETGYLSLTEHWYRGALLDVSQVFLCSTIIISASLAYFLGSISATSAVMITSLFAVLTTLGLFGLMSIELNPASILSTLMVLVLGLADGIHITKSVRRLLAAGKTKKESIIEAVTSNFLPIALTSVTTAIGFLTFNLTGYEGIRNMGNYVALGVIAAFIFSITLLPATLVFCSVKPETQRFNFGLHNLVSSAIIKYYKSILVLTVPAVLLSIYMISYNVFDERITRYLKEDYVFTAHLNAIQRDLTGTTSIIYNLNAGESGGINNPEFMNKVDAFATWARQQPEVRHVSSYTDFLKTLNKNLHNDDDNYYRIPETKGLAAQYTLLYELSLPYGLDLTNQLNLDKSGTRMVLTTNDMSYLQAEDFLQRSNKWLNINANDISAKANSNSLSSLLMTEDTIRINIYSGVIALVIIGSVLLFAFRSIYIGVICVISVVSPILVTYGLWGVSIGKLDIPATLAICMVIGIAVDFSVHFISKFSLARKQYNYSKEDSIKYSFKMVSAAISTSVFVLGFGFAVLTLSVFRFNWVMGALTSMCIFFAALSTFLLVPSILLVGKPSTQSVTDKAH